MKQSGRLTNLQLLVALLVTFATGVGAVATGSAHGAWIAIAHGIAAMVVILLVPWKSTVVRAGLALHPYARWFSLALAGLTVATLLLGLGYATGLLRDTFGQTGLWLHVLLALSLLPLLVWHLATRRVRPRRTDLSRRVLVRAGLLAAVGAGLYLTTSTVVTVAGLPGRSRRFTGSYETGSFAPDRMPDTIWLADTPPVIDASQWRLTVVDARGEYDLDLTALRNRSITRRETIDCTSGWYAEQDWTGTPVADLLREIGSARSLRVTSATGYWIRLPVRDLPNLLLATDIADVPLSVGHGFPLRLVAAGRRGYWWVKWVERIELERTPWWWQPPFPVT